MEAKTAQHSSPPFFKGTVHELVPSATLLLTTLLEGPQHPETKSTVGVFHFPLTLSLEGLDATSVLDTINFYSQLNGESSAKG